MVKRGFEPYLGERPAGFAQPVELAGKTLPRSHAYKPSQQPLQLQPMMAGEQKQKNHRAEIQVFLIVQLYIDPSNFLTRKLCCCLHPKQLMSAAHEGAPRPPLPLGAANLERRVRVAQFHCAAQS